MPACDRLDQGDRQGQVVAASEIGDIGMADQEATRRAGGISVHAVDIARGVPAGGLALRLYRVEPERRIIASGTCASGGLFEHPIVDGAGVERGFYEVEFDVGAYYRANGVAIPDPAFLDVALFRFGIDRVAEHFHLPFKFTPWGFSLFRGGA